MQLAIEAKASEKITAHHLKGLRQLVKDHARIGRRVVVSREPNARCTEDGIEVLPAAGFLHRLRRGEFF